MKRCMAMLAATSCALSVSGFAHAQSCEESSGTTISQSGEYTLDAPQLGFGSAVSGSGQRVAVGYPAQNLTGEIGSVSFFIPDGSNPGSWILEQSVSYPYEDDLEPGQAPSSPVAGIQFGRALSIAGSRAIAGVNGSIYGVEDPIKFIK